MELLWQVLFTGFIAYIHEDRELGAFKRTECDDYLHWVLYRLLKLYCFNEKITLIVVKKRQDKN